jgi:radical SAM protein with 4Fe4S-binding SPASM domain
MIIGRHVAEIIKDNKVVLANQETGRWIRISNEVYEIIKYMLENNYSVEEMTDNFESKDDCLFVKDIYNSLIQSNIICSKDYTFDKQNKIASVQLTNRCNLKCIHCCVDAKSNDTLETDLSTEQIKNIFDKLIIWNPLNIMLSGGEPMIREDFLELLEYLRNNYTGNIILSTNSLFINNENVEKLAKYCDSFEISIDGVDEKTCSMVRGKGVFDKVCRNVELLKSYGVSNIKLSMVFSDKNDHLMQQFNELNNKLGTEPVCRNFSAVGRGALNKEFFSDKDAEDYYIPPEYLAENYDEPFGISFCSAGKKEIFIGCDGRLYPCPSYMSDNFAMGNVLLSNKIDDLLKSDGEQYVCEHVNKSHPKNLPTCKNCEVKLFCWTCPGEAMEITNEKAFNKRCELTKPVLIKRIWG